MPQAQEKEEQQPEETTGPEVLPSSEPKVSIDLAELDEPDDNRAETPQERKSKRQQWREVKEGRNRDAEELKSLRQELAELRGRFQNFPQFPQQGQQQRQAEPADPNESKIESIEAQQQVLLQAIRSANDGEVVKSAETQWRKLERQRRDLEIEAAIARRGLDKPPKVDEIEMGNMALRAEYPEIFADDALRLQVQAEMLKLHRQGKPVNLATAREAAERVSPKRVSRPPSEAEKAKHISVSSRAGAQGSASGNYTPSTAELRTARGYTNHLPNLSDEERVKIWMRDVGRRIQR